VLLVFVLLGCAAPPDKAGTLLIASWNIENFGRTKATDPHRMEAIARVLRDYDIIAIQEVSNLREMSDPGCPRNADAGPGHRDYSLIKNALERYLNQAYGQNYRFVFSPQIKDERYLLIYDPDKVSFEGASLVEDPEDTEPVWTARPKNTGKMVRQPFKAKFRAGKFDFVLLTVHTSPSVNLKELEGLEYFYREAQRESEPDVIILGDLNADCDYLREADVMSLKGREYIWVVDDGADTTVGATDCAYDRFIFTEPTREDFTGRWGIRTDVPEDVSDHRLIWAEFSTRNDSD